MPTIRWHPSDDHAHQTNSLIIQKHIACAGSSQSHLELHQEDVPCLAILVQIRHETVSPDTLVPGGDRFALYKYFGVVLDYVGHDVVTPNAKVYASFRRK
jgi:hypothetical protein